MSDPTLKVKEHRLSSLLDVPQLAKCLGITVRHVRRLVSERRIPYIKVGRLVRFDPDDVATWLQGLRVLPNPRAVSIPHSHSTR